MCEKGLLIDGEYGVKERVMNDDGLIRLIVFYTLAEDGLSKEKQERELRRFVEQAVKMSVHLGGDYFGAGYEIKITRALSFDVREVLELLTCET